MKENEIATATPEHLLQMLEVRMVMQRERSQRSSRNRMMFLAGGLLFIVLGAATALFVLMQMLSDLQPGQRPGIHQSVPQTDRENF